MDNIPSPLLKRCVSELAKLPGIGKKTALRLAIHLLKQKPDYAIALGNSIIDLKKNIKFCTIFSFFPFSVNKHGRDFLLLNNFIFFIDPNPDFLNNMVSGQPCSRICRAWGSTGIFEFPFFNLG